MKQIDVTKQWNDDTLLLKQLIHRHSNQHKRKLYWSHLLYINKQIKLFNEKTDISVFRSKLLVAYKTIKEHLLSNGTFVGLAMVLLGILARLWYILPHLISDLPSVQSVALGVQLLKKPIEAAQEAAVYDKELHSLKQLAQNDLSLNFFSSTPKRLVSEKSSGNSGNSDKSAKSEKKKTKKKTDEIDSIFK
jgi:hypothetical protein